MASGCGLPHTHIYIYMLQHSFIPLPCAIAWLPVLWAGVGVHGSLQAQQAMASLPEGLILPAKTAAVPGHDLMCLSCREGCRLLNGRSHS